MWIEIVFIEIFNGFQIVTPCAGVWIEICVLVQLFLEVVVTPCAGVWIEIYSACNFL